MSNSDFCPCTLHYVLTCVYIHVCVIVYVRMYVGGGFMPGDLAKRLWGDIYFNKTKYANIYVRMYVCT